MSRAKQLADAIDAFVKGTKADGTWDSIKACCILAGWDSLDGCLVPLKGPAPTNNNFAEADYNRETGLVGDGSTTYLDSNRANDADPQDDKHIAVYASDPGSDSGAVRGWIYAGNNGTVGSSGIGYRDSDGVSLFQVNNQNAAFPTLSSPSGLVGATRSSSSEFVYRVNGVNATASETSSTPDSGDLVLYQRASSNFTTARLAFYSIGESLDLAALDTRVTALITAIGAAI